MRLETLRPDEQLVDGRAEPGISRDSDKNDRVQEDSGYAHQSELDFNIVTVTESLTTSCLTMELSSSLRLPPNSDYLTTFLWFYCQNYYIE